MPEQPTLVSQSKDSRGKSQGPVFDKKTRLKKKITLLLIAVVAILFFMKNNGGKQDSINKTETDGATISVTVIRSDGYTKVARRALANYLSMHSEELLTNGQKVFIEDKLRRTLNQHLVVGEEVDFEMEKLQTLVVQAKSLSRRQLDKWDVYARSVKF